MRKRLTQKQVKERDEIVFGKAINWAEESSGGIIRFRELGLEELEALVEKGYIDPEEAQNSSPTVGEILGFMKKYPAVTAHGYVVSPDREEERVSLEGIECEASEVTDELRMDFVDLARYADEFEYRTSLYAWWD